MFSILYHISYIIYSLGSMYLNVRPSLIALWHDNDGMAFCSCSAFRMCYEGITLETVATQSSHCNTIQQCTCTQG